MNLFITCENSNKTTHRESSCIAFPWLYLVQITCIVSLFKLLNCAIFLAPPPKTHVGNNNALFRCRLFSFSERSRNTKNTRILSSGNTRILSSGNTRILSSGNTRILSSGNTRILSSGNTRILSSGNTRILSSGNIRIPSSGNT